MMQGKSTQDFYLIGVIAEELGMHPQTLRKYEHAGFVTPRRMGAIRLYSNEDSERLRVIKHFAEKLGLNIAGIELALKMTTQLLQLRAQLGAIKEPSRSDKDTLNTVDGMLSEFGLRVAEDKRPMRPKEMPEPQMASFVFRPGHVLRITVVKE